MEPGPVIKSQKASEKQSKSVITVLVVNSVAAISDQKVEKPKQVWSVAPSVKMSVLKVSITS
jgi:hypothetical protein